MALSPPCADGLLSEEKSSQKKHDVRFKLPSDDYSKLVARADGANISANIMAQRLCATALYAPNKNEITEHLYEQSLSIEFLTNEVETLSQQIERLSIALGVVLNTFLVVSGVEPTDAEGLISSVLTQSGES